MQGAGQDTPGVGQCQHILGLEAEAEYPGRGWKTQGPPGGRGGGRQATLGNFVEIYNPMICMFQFWALPLTKSLFVARHRGMRKVQVVSVEFDTILMM